jgi:catechol 2,3-dioxygenase-like lactoylglutathione lyase family enzyme
VFDHVTIRVADRDASERFYDIVLITLGIAKTVSDEWYAEWDDFSLGVDRAELTRNLHVGFAAPSREAVDEFHRIGVAAGYRSDGEPGPRPQYRDDYYGGFLLDPDGNSIEAVHHGGMRGGGIDHLWIRVADVAAARGFYEAIAPYSGFALEQDAHFVGPRSSFSLVEGEPSENVHIAFPAAENATVDAFHAAATQAGYGDNGAPGERPIYHPGYYAAYVLDPDGNNIEVVNHNRG